MCASPTPTPPGLEQVIARALAKRPEERFATAGELLQALQATDLHLIPQPPQPVAGFQPISPPTSTTSTRLNLDTTMLTPSQGQAPVKAEQPVQSARKWIWLVIGRWRSYWF